MNYSKSSHISLWEIPQLLPAWFNDNYTLTFRLLKTNKFHNFQTVKTFLVASLSDITCAEDEKKNSLVKHIKVKVFDKGIKDNQQYVSVEVYPVLADGSVFKITQSCKVSLREPMTHD